MAKKASKKSKGTSEKAGKPKGFTERKSVHGFKVYSPPEPPKPEKEKGE